MHQDPRAVLVPSTEKVYDRRTSYNPPGREIVSISRWPSRSTYVIVHASPYLRHLPICTGLGHFFGPRKFVTESSDCLPIPLPTRVYVHSHSARRASISATLPRTVPPARIAEAWETLARRTQHSYKTIERKKEGPVVACQS